MEPPGQSVVSAASAATTQRAAAGGRSVTAFGNTTQVWHEQTVQRLRAADETANSAVSARNTAQKTSATVGREVQQAHGAVNAWLKQKAQHTLALKLQLEKAIAVVSEESTILLQQRKQVEEQLMLQRTPLAKAQHRLRQRQLRRPQRENINDPVQEALQQEVAEAERGLQMMNAGFSEMSQTLEQLQLCKRMLREDLEDKSKALEVDNSCLAAPAFADNVFAGQRRRPPLAPLGFVRKTLANALEEAAAAGVPPTVTGSNGDVRQLAKQSATHPEQWKKETKDKCAAAAALVGDSRKLRARALSLTQQAAGRTRNRGERTTQVLEERIRQTTSLAVKLQARLDDVDQELADIAAQRVAVTSALGEKHAPLHTCARRLALRRHRPTRETVRDDAEIDLQTQLESLVHNCKHLEVQHRLLEERERELRRLRGELESDKWDKEMARELDTELLTLDPVALGGPAEGSRPSTPASVSASSPSVGRRPSLGSAAAFGNLGTPLRMRRGR
eukprot:TRINITY_DN1057_c2_g1_i1.p1 TRINITY_DN1057_c2_g1~~TRINITY_DN1057_c2_g1_i1.p1  ORF type:complete len:531 (+),score=192.98 TRINITY_DN1057_c2_g1_i1:81-1595(+)